MIRALAPLLLVALGSCAATPDKGVAELPLPSCTVPTPRLMVSRSYLVFFDPGSARLTERAMTILGEFARTASQYSNIHVTVSGNTDGAEAGLGLAWLGTRRAETAAQFLASMGVSIDQISAKGYGASRPLVHAPGREPQNRRVEVVLRSGSNGPVDREDRANRNQCRAWLGAHCLPSSSLPHAGAAVCEQVWRTTLEQEP